MTPTFVMGVPWDQQRVRRVSSLVNLVRAQVVWDTDHSAMNTWRAALAEAGEGPAIFLEDDVVLAGRWREQVEAEIAERPDEVIQFFSLREADAEKGSRYMPGRTYLMNQCHYLPAGLSRQIHEWTEGWQEQHPEHPSGTDAALADFLKVHKMRYWLRVPSLVQHENWRSAINERRPRTRQSPTFEEA